MKTIRCINSKSYNLTIGREYQTLRDTDNNDRYSIINDRGLDRNYDATLFEDVVTRLSNDEIFASITPLEDNIISIENREGETLTFSFLDGGASIARTPISCGIFQLVGVNTISDRIAEFVESNFREESLEFKLDLAKNIFNIGFQSSTEDIQFASIVISTNINHPTFEVIDSVLSDRGGIVETMRNPNSGNDIKFWYITKEQITA